MRALLAIAGVTLGDAVRRRLFWTVLIFALLLCAGSLVLGQMVVGDGAKVIKDLGLSGMSFFGLVMAVWLSSEALGRALEAAPAEPLLSRGVPREVFLCARFLGLAAVLLLSTLAMGLASWLLLRLMGEPFGWGLFEAGLLIYVELLVVAAAGFLFASLLRPAVALYATLCLVIVGRSMGEAKHILAAQAKGPEWQGWAYRLLPDLSRLDIKAAAVHNLAIPANDLAASALYGLGYAGLLLVAAILAFEWRNLT